MSKLKETILKLADGNPGAMRVLFELMKYHPDGQLILTKFDDLGIYGSLIWLCYKDLLNFDIAKLFDLLRTNKLKQAIEDGRKANEGFKKEWDYHAKEMMT